MLTAKNILAVRNDRFGEFLLNIPAFRALKRSFGGSKLTLVVNPYVGELAKSIDFVDEVITWENRRHNFGEIIKFSKEVKDKKFDLCVIFNPSKEFNIISFLAGIPMRVGYQRKWGFLLTHKMEDKKYLGQKHEIEYNLELVNLVGVKTEDKTLSLKIQNDIINELCKDCHIENYDNLIALHPFTSDPIKQWPIEYFSRLAKKLIKELNKKVIIIGGKEEVDKSKKHFADLGADIVNLTGRTTLTQLAALFKKCKLLISGDSGPVHLASCVGIPVVAIFRNDIPGKNSLRWGPTSFESIVLEKPNLSDIRVEEVFEKAKKILE